MKALTFETVKYYICGMQRAQCPVCKSRWPRKLAGYAPHKKEVILCHNEFYIHVIRNGQHFLAHTERAKVEEGDNTIQNIQLVLN